MRSTLDSTVEAAETVRQETAFAIVPLWLLRRASPRAIQVYAWLAGRYANAEGTGAYPSYQRLGDDLQVSSDVIMRSVNELRELNAIETRRKHRADGSLAGLEYVLLQQRRKSADQASRLSSKSAVQGTSQTRKSAVTPPAKMRLHDPDPVQPDLKDQRERLDATLDMRLKALSHFTTEFAAVQGFEPFEITAERENIKLDQAVASMGLDRVCSAMTAYMRADGLAATSGYALAVFLRQPTRYLAKQQAGTVDSGEGARQAMKVGNVEQVCDGRIADQIRNSL